MTLVLRPQPGFQTRFCASKADIAIGGGTARSGKTFAVLMMGAKHFERSGWNPVFFRRTMVQVKQPDGLWSQASKIYPQMGAWPNLQERVWTWPSGAQVKMAHLEHDHTVYDWQGSMSPLFVFDELTHFAESSFWYIVSRNGASGGVKPRIRATCNPDADSWVATLIEWWIDQDPDSPTYGLPINERAGVLRWLTRVNDALVWGNTPEQVMEKVPGIAREHIKSLTFVPGKLSDNRIFEAQDPSYRGNLMLQNRVERGRLLDGNWKIRANPGDVFKEHEVTMLDDVPDDVVQWVRCWDLAATEPSALNPDPDWTCGVKMGRRRRGGYVVAHAIFERKNADTIRQLIKRTAENDGSSCAVRLPQDPGQAGKAQAQSMIVMLGGSEVKAARETGPKTTRAEPFASQWQGGNVFVVRGAWNREYFSQMEGFPGVGVHDDAVDASAGAFDEVAGSFSMFDVL